MICTDAPRFDYPEDDYEDIEVPGARGKQRGASSRAYSRKLAAGSVSGPRGTSSSPRLEGDVIAAYGRHFLVSPGDGQAPLEALAVGRRLDCVVGDRVLYRLADSGPSAVESVLPRRNRVMRSDHFRQKTIAANVDQAAVLISGYPFFDEAVLLRVLLGLSAEEIPVLLLLTKQDLKHSFDQAMERASVYETLGYPVIPTAARNAPASLDALRVRLTGKRTILLGQSGMGKSTLLNALIPSADQQTQAISDALASGRHTTTFSRAFTLPDGPGWLIDSPGFQQFELAHLSHWQICHAMPEFRPLLGRCRFNDCQHQDEPGCAIREAAESGQIDPRRYELFRELR
ncbi:MAG: ribosome small subunit-dependent GTPase A [Lautropia sp.]|nr:ribosome small subunit-dependent GTPase A [Lautropia sp.]